MHPTYPFARPVYRPRLDYAAVGARTRRTPYLQYALFLTTLSVAGSVFPSLRIGFGGLMVHLYLLPIGLIALYLALTDGLRYVSSRILAPLALSGFLYVLAILNRGMDAGEIVKIVAAITTIVCVASIVRSERGFLVGVVGMGLAGAIIGAKGIFNIEGLTVGANAMGSIANENATSLYTLPPLLLLGLVLRNMKQGPWLRFALITAMLVIIVSTFLSANRSGWLGVGLIFLLILAGSRGKVGSLAVLVVISMIAYFVFASFQSDAFFYALQSSLDGRSQDGARWDLIVYALEVGVENPVLGVGPRELYAELGQRMNPYSAAPSIVSHNVVAHVIGAAGFGTALAFAWLGFRLWVPPGKLRRRWVGELGVPFSLAILRMLLVLWFFRGMFTHEILYSPSFNVALGLSIGLCRTKGVWSNA